MSERFYRTEILIGEENVRKLNNSTVAIFGIGGVGSFTVEALARAGVGNLILIDHDQICETNINRQIHALTETIGKFKVDVMKERILSINPAANIKVLKEFYLPQNGAEIFPDKADYIVDAIDTVTAKIDIVVKATEKQIPIISAMGAGNKLEPSKFEVADIFKTSVDPLARVMRKELRSRGVKKLKVVYSKEEPKKNDFDFPGSISFVPSTVGLIIAGEVIKDILHN